MKKIVSINLVFIMLFLSIDAFALITKPSPKTNQTKTTFLRKQMEANLGRKLKFKEKIGLWLFKRKLKKIAQKQSITNFPTNPFTDSTYCATIYLNSGEHLQAKLLEITETSVKFVRCGTKDVMSISKNDIMSISLYDNITLYESPNILVSKKNIIQKKRKAKKSKYLGPLSLLSTFLAFALGFFHPALFFFLIVLALTFGIAGAVNSEKKYQEIAIISLLLGLLAMIKTIS